MKYTNIGPKMQHRTIINAQGKTRSDSVVAFSIVLDVADAGAVNAGVADVEEKVKGGIIVNVVAMETMVR